MESSTGFYVTVVMIMAIGSALVSWLQSTRADKLRKKSGFDANNILQHNYKVLKDQALMYKRIAIGFVAICVLAYAIKWIL